MSAVEEILGFTPSEFMDQLFSDIDDELENTVSKLKKDLVANAASKGLSESEIDAGCEALKVNMAAKFQKNLDKFELYSYRNIFSIPGSDATAPGISSDVAATSGDLNVLRDKYSGMKRRYEAMTKELVECEKAVGDMKTALFNIRVGAQTLDAHNVQPLVETAEQLCGLKKQLEDATARADTLTANMMDGKSRGSSVTEDGSLIEPSIKSGDAEQMQKLSRQMA